jgi:hypothetical protein
VKVLRDQRADGAAGHDDRPLGAERSAAADDDARGQRLEQRDLGDILLLPNRIASMASGMPWPRILSEP